MFIEITALKTGDIENMKEKILMNTDFIHTILEYRDNAINTHLIAFDGESTRNGFVSIFIKETYEEIKKMLEV